MGTSYEIFKNDPAGPTWVETISDLDKVTDRLKLLSDLNSCEYFAYDLWEAKIVARSPAAELSTTHAYDVFRRDKNGKRTWVETIIGLNDVEKHLLKLASTKPGDT
jgi:hypothetical protein